jgi:cyclopropane-fatty-acyl-phospholipid synthase
MVFLKIFPPSASPHLRETIQTLLGAVDVQINGNRPWDIQVHNEQLYARLLSEGSIAAGESYMEGWWDCKQLDELFYRVLRGNAHKALKAWNYWDILRAKWFNLQTLQRAFQVGKRHYDLGNLLYECMLDRRMIYSCGYWKNASTLEEAQTAKIDLIARKLDLHPGMRVLDIGCGWGGAAQYLAEHYQVEVVGITISQEQVNLARSRCRGWPVEIRLQDYRDLDESFDRIFSVGMFEHVGYKNYRTYFEQVKRCLKDNGRFLLHTIGTNLSEVRSDPWIERYIFPNSMIPSAQHITTAAEGLMVLEDWHCFGQDYDKTLMQWFHNFQQNWDRLKALYSDRFYRMWTYYLLSCAGSFRARKNQLWQVLFSPRGIVGGCRVNPFDAN